MQTPIRPINNDNGNAFLPLLGFVVAVVLILLSQVLFIVPAGNVAVVTTLGKVTGEPRSAGPNFKVPLIQNIAMFDIKTQVRPEEFSSLTKDLQVIEATATIKYAIRSNQAGRIFRSIATANQQVYGRIVQPSLLKALKSVFSQYELVTIASEWNSISEIVQEKVSEELSKFGYVDVQGLDLTGLRIAEEYRAAIEQKQIADQRLLKARTEVRIADQEAKRYETLNKSLNDQVLYKLFLDKWDGTTTVVPGIPGGSGQTPPVIVQGKRRPAGIMGRSGEPA